jgi:hypothetical protein
MVTPAGCGIGVKRAHSAGESVGGASGAASAAIPASDNAGSARTCPASSLRRSLPNSPAARCAHSRRPARMRPTSIVTGRAIGS